MYVELSLMRRKDIQRWESLGGIYTFPGNLFVPLFDEYSWFDLRVCLFSLLIAFSGRDAVSRLL